MMASLRQVHRGGLVALAICLPLGLTWAVAGRTPLAVGAATTPEAEAEPDTRLARAPGTHLGDREGELVVASADDPSEAGAVRVHVDAPSSAPSGDVVLYAAKVEPALKSDLPASARWLGPQLRRGAPATYLVRPSNGEAFVVAYDLAIATVVGSYRLDAARTH